MKTKLIGTIWRGSASVDPRFSAAMLKWIVTDIRNRNTFTKLSIGIENGVLETYNIDFELQFKHQIKYIIGMCLISSQKPAELKNLKIPNIDKIIESNFVQLNGSKTGFIYLLKIPIDPLLHIYLYEIDSINEIVNLIQMIQNVVQTSYDSFGQIPQNIISNSKDANDESLKKILSRSGIQTTPASNLKMSVSIKEKGGEIRPRLISSKSYTSGFNQINNKPSLSNSTTMVNIASQTDDDPPNHSQFFEVMFLKKIDLLENHDPQEIINETVQNYTTINDASKEEVDKKKSLDEDEASSISDENEDDDDEKLFEQNRIIVLLIGHDLRLISPDRKQTLLCKSFNDISSFYQGNLYNDHFVIIFRNLINPHNFMGFIFKCQAKSIVDDVISAISLMKITKKKENLQIIACESCPMLWYHNLCVDIESLSDKKTYAYIKNQIEKLSMEEQNIILIKYNAVEDVVKGSLAEQNQFLMMLLRAHCEYKNERHIHDLEGNKHYFTQPLSSKTFFMKAKRSLTNSFDHLLKRKNKFDETKNTSDRISLNLEMKYHDIDISESSPSCSSIDKSPLNLTPKSHFDVNERTIYTKSWRQEIFQRVITPSKNFNRSLQESYLSPFQLTSNDRDKEHDKSKPRTRDELRVLWKTAVRQIIMLSRMEKENAQLQAKQNENEIKRIKLEYDDISNCAKEANDHWDELIKTKNNNRIILLQAIKNGVSRQKRGEIWLFLAEQYATNIEIDYKKFPNFKTPYKELLKSFTEHQHAIFIDLGRTFPNHKFYKQSLGVGQLSLFNLLKAYSILDPELGYCQGLGFICGILLLHLDENEAFEMLKYLMFNREMRLKYLPEMKHFQLQLYQLSRLIKDYLPDLYDWLEKKDISTTLYAAPWILTIFSSQFSLGFVTRVFDLLFLESSEIIFKVSLALLIIHKNQLLSMDNFEDVIDYLKNVVPKVDNVVMERVLKIVFTTNITILLNEYQVEYNVLQEEINLQNQQLNILETTKKEKQNLSAQLESAQTCIKQLENLQNFQKSQIDKLQLKVKNFQTTVEFLQGFINLLIELNKNIEIPEEIKHLFNKLNNNNNNNNMDEEFNLKYLDKKHVDHVLRFLDEILNDHQLSNDTRVILLKIYDHFKNLNQLNIDLVQVDSGVSTPVSPELQNFY